MENGLVCKECGGSHFLAQFAGTLQMTVETGGLISIWDTDADLEWRCEKCGKVNEEL